LGPRAHCPTGHAADICCPARVRLGRHVPVCAHQPHPVKLPHASHLASRDTGAEWGHEGRAA
jgi:hypothetical protein